MMNTGNMSDSEFIAHIYNKDAPTEDELAAATRLETLLHFYEAQIERVNRLSSVALEAGHSPELQEIHMMTSRVSSEGVMTLQ
jgi:nitric oxide reductase activation protein